MVPDGKFQAKYILPVDQPPISNGVVEIVNGMITAVGKMKTPESEVVDLGEVCLIPGLVNAHTHLEFSNCKLPLGKAGMNFVDWIACVIQSRRSMEDSEKVASIQKGLVESSEQGVVALGEIGTEPLQLATYESNLHVTLFFERLGFRREQSQQVADRCEDFLNLPKSNATSKAISPHAPYSVHPDLLNRLVELSTQYDVPIAMHLAETQDELHMLRDQRGRFVELLESLGLWSKEVYQPGTTVLDLLKKLKRCSRSLIIHGNYLSDSEIGCISQNRTQMSVVYCPRTHDYFEHETYPLKALINAGINVGIGTDSRASNPDLDLFAELKMISKKFSDRNAESILKFGTVNGAIALGISDQFGAIGAGLDGQINVVNSKEPSELLADDAECLPIRKYLAS